MGSWLATNWFTLLQTVGIVAGFLFTGISLLIDSKVRRASNLISLTKNHRDIWSQFYRQPELTRILETSVDLKAEPISAMEERFVKLLILHLNSAYTVLQDGFVSKPENLSKDIQSFFSLPIPRKVWEKHKHFHDRRFVIFVETRMNQSQEESVREDNAHFSDH